MLTIHGERIYGIDVDPQTRCAHYQSEPDIIAIKFKCCGRWFPCYQCHKAVAEHEAEIWPVDEKDAKAVLCGACGRQLSIAEYLGGDSSCSGCGSKFNPGCAKHYHLYFAQKTEPNML